MQEGCQNVNSDTRDHGQNRPGAEVSRVYTTIVKMMIARPIGGLKVVFGNRLCSDPSRSACVSPGMAELFVFRRGMTLRIAGARVFFRLH
jgi:hypothetical protein